MPFGAHKGYGLSLINELVAAFIGGSLPTLRGRPKPDSEKSSANFYFQVIHPDSMNSGLFARGRTQNENIKSVLKCILDDGNENCLWPGEMEANAATKTAKAGGLLFTEAEIAAFNEIAKDNGSDVWDKREFATFPV